MDTAEAATTPPAPGLTNRVGALTSRIGSIGADPADSRELRDRKGLLVLSTVLVQPAGLMWGGLYWAYGEHVAALIPWAYMPASLLALLVFARTRSFRFLRAAQLTLILVLPALLLLALGGITPSSGIILWSLLAPVGAVVYDSPRRAWAWFAAFIALLAVTVPLAPLVRSSPSELPAGLIRAFAVLNIATPSLVVFALLTAFALQRQAAQGRVESLLLNVLPREIAERLQAAPGAIADQFEDTSILFADIVDFTPLSARMTPTELVSLLDVLFTRFDDLSDDYGVEKIKTIGDCYMVAAGVPAARADHAQALARMALDMHRCAAECLEGEGYDLQLRIGISSGPVVAGVIGRRRFLYDLWGDTVNMASRMESHGTAGEIQITRPSWELLRYEFECHPLGLVEVKGKGPVETWQLVGPG